MAKKRGAAPAPRRPRAEPEFDASASADDGVESALRDWRLAEAKRRGVPAFRILTDRTLKELAARRPASAAELLAVPGIGISTVEKYAAQIYRLVQTRG